MRKIWINIDPWDKELVTTALEGGADGVLVPAGYSEKVKALGRIDTIAEDGDIRIGVDVVTRTIESGQDEEEIARISKITPVILECTDWTVIPLENLIARGADVIARVNSLEEAEIAFGILEKGVGQILLSTRDPVEIKKTLARFKSDVESIALETAEITDIQPAGMGDRVCVDTCTHMEKGEGILVGNSSGALFLVHAESVVNPYVSPRPFRVNAGPVHAYTRVPGNKTRYLSELAAGDPVLITNYTGLSSVGTVGRVKIEKRPLLLIRARASDQEITAIVQNAETIRLTDPKGNPVSVVALKPGGKVLVALEIAGRHFGMQIDETIMER